MLTTVFVSGKGLRWSRKKEAYDQQSFFAYSIAISILMIGGGRLLGLDEFLSTFVAGLVFSDNVEREDIQNIQVRATISLLDPASADSCRMPWTKSSP